MVKKHTLLLSNLVVILVIIAGFSAIVYKDATAYQALSEEHLENIVNLAEINIAKQIETSMSKPVTVSKTMANDEFLKAWLISEPENCSDDLYLEDLYGYLKAYQEKYGYTTVFCVSALTGNYYYQDGFNKTLSKADDHDIWYYNFLDTGHEYDLEVDTSEQSDNAITVFVNFRVESSDGELLGVIGVGLRVTVIENTIASYAKDYDLSVYIINHRGAENSFTGNTDIFISEDSLAENTGINEEIVLNKSETPILQWFTANGERKCLITEYNETLGWFLLLEKDTDTISRAFQESIKNSIIFMLISLFACITVVTTVFIHYNRRLISMENTDDLTGLPNMKLFTRMYPKYVRKHRAQRQTMFMFDIDHFKDVNDTKGHLFGNAVLSMVGDELKNAVDGYGIASRWGGDEFLGVLAVAPEEAERILDELMQSLRSEDKDESFRVTVSVGIMETHGKLNLEQLLKSIDEALYKSKETGRNRITIAK